MGNVTQRSLKLIAQGPALTATAMVPLHKSLLVLYLPLARLLRTGEDSEPSLAGAPVIDLLLALWPLFALIVCGFELRRRGFPSEAFWPGAERLNYFILFPALLFSALATAPLHNPQLPRLTLAVLLGLGSAWLALLLVRNLRGWTAARFGAFSQGALRFNTYLGLAVTGSLFGQAGLSLAALMLALMVPAVNLLSVWSLSSGKALSATDLLIPIVRNPLILACLAGALCNLSNIGLGSGVDRLLSLLAAASLPLGLLCVGAALRPQQLRDEIPALIWNSLLRLLAMPLLALFVAHLLQLSKLESSLLILFFALPTAPSAYVLTRQLGGDSSLMAGIITLQHLLAALSLPLLLAII